MKRPVSKSILIRTLVIAAIVSLLLAATKTGGDRSEIKIGKEHRFHESALKNLVDAKLPENLSDLKFRYEKRKTFRGPASDHSVLISQQAVYHVGRELKNVIALPFEMEVVFKECKAPDSYYDEASHQIVICYELIDVYSELFSRTIKERTGRDEAAKGAVVAMFLHEVAHVLIDGWDLSITGREEDAADQFSTLMLINVLPDSEEMAVHGARSFESLAFIEKGLEKDYSDSHSVDEQRFYNTICLLYGHRPERYEYLVRNGSLPAERAVECQEEYARVNKSWQALLAPYLVRRSEPFSSCD